MRAAIPIYAALLILSSCGTPPKPPTVEESKKRPVNVAAAVELQTCKSDLQNTRILASETTRLAESASATATRLALQQQAMASHPPDVEMANMVYTVLFAFGSTQVAVPAPERDALIERARSATLVMLRGRTDGSAETPAESRISRERALAVRTYLTQSGVEPSRIRMTWQPVGDTVADNGTPSGRSLNRRVEIEMYRLAPQRFAAGAASSAL